MFPRKILSGEKNWTLEDEMKKNGNLRKSDFNELKDFSLTLPKVDKSMITNEVLVALLHGSNYDLKCARSVATKYFSIRLSLPQIFADYDLESEEMQTAFDLGFFCPLRERSPQGFRIVFAGLRRPETSLFCYESMLKGFAMVVDACAHEDPTSPGYIFVHDFNFFSLAHLWKMNMFLTKKLASYNEEGIPIITEVHHCVNVGSFALKAFCLIKPFLSKHVFDKFKFHSGTSSEEFLQSVPKEYLPRDYGGLLPDLETLQKESLEWLKRIEYKMDSSHLFDDS